MFMLTSALGGASEVANAVADAEHRSVERQEMAREQKFEDHNRKHMQWEKAVTALQMHHAKKDNSMERDSEQLAGLASVSALIAGFSMVLMVEASLDDGDEVLPTYLLYMYGGSGTLVLVIMLYTTVVCLLLLFVRAQELHMKSNTRFEKDFAGSLKLFLFGIAAFLLNMMVFAWVKFWRWKPGIPIIMNAIVIVGLIAIARVTFHWTTVMNRGTTEGEIQIFEKRGEEEMLLKQLQEDARDWLQLGNTSTASKVKYAPAKTAEPLDLVV